MAATSSQVFANGIEYNSGTDTSLWFSTGCASATSSVALANAFQVANSGPNVYTLNSCSNSDFHWQLVQNGNLIWTNVQQFYRTRVAAQITLTGPNSTKVLPAGPILRQTATVTENGTPKAGVGVTITVASQSGYGGSTDALGQFQFDFVPTQPGTANLQATCSGCSNTASNNIKVDTAEAPICKANPVDIGSGKKLEFASDWQDNGPHPISVTRTYSSAGIASATLGDYWSHNFAAALTPVLGGTGLQSRAVRLGNGISVAFNRANSSSQWASDNGKDLLVESAQGDTFYRASDETRWLFAPYTHQLLSITQRNGWAMQLGYNTAAQLVTVTNAFGRVLSLAYNPQGQVSSIASPDAKTLSYSYDSQQRLTGALNSDTTQRSYLYEDTRWPNALTGQINEAGVRLGTYTYDAQGCASGSSHAGGVQNYSFSYPVTADRKLTH